MTLKMIRMKPRTWQAIRNMQGILNEMRSLLNGWVKGMPDLSFYPENVLRDKAFVNPVRFGMEHQQDISRLVDLADLSLLPFEEAREGLASALESDDPMEVYWGLIVCSCFGSRAKEFYRLAGGLCMHEDLLVRTRAAEFLGLTGMMNPVPVLVKALEESKNDLEALLILNSVVLLRDGKPGYAFDLSKLKLDPEIAGDPEVQRRLDYLLPGISQP